MQAAQTIWLRAGQDSMARRAVPAAIAFRIVRLMCPQQWPLQSTKASLLDSPIGKQHAVRRNLSDQ